MKNKIKIGVTIGDINGIGLEIFAKFFTSAYFKKVQNSIKFILFGNTNSIVEYFRKIRLNVKSTDNILYILGHPIEIVFVEPYVRVKFGKIDAGAGELSANSIRTATQYALEGKIDCFVTLPIAKESLALAKSPFYSHTEFIAELCGVSNPLMLFVYRRLRVALLTIHEPIANVPTLINPKSISDKVTAFANSLRFDFGISNPKIAMLGLNPHSGESGLIGTEENEIIAPTLKNLTERSISIEGPYPADSFFGFGLYKLFDGILACYHDQGLIPFKLLTKGWGVNFTANLPIIRTSPDHGTAFDIAGEGRANPSSLIESIRLAIGIYKQRKKSSY
jgi:4-hydroxythreonine-4-phosphate dehydrogenase